MTPNERAALLALLDAIEGLAATARALLDAPEPEGPLVVEDVPAPRKPRWLGDTEPPAA